VEAGIPSYKTPEQAIRAFMTLVAYSRNLETLYETPKDIPLEFSPDREELRKTFNRLTKNNPAVLPEDISKTILTPMEFLLQNHGLPPPLRRL